MSYLTQDEIAANLAMNSRIAQCAASQDTPMDPDSWTTSLRRTWAAAPGWDAAWESAKVSHPDDPDVGGPGYDPGADESVITDGQILSQVQAMLATP